MRINQVTIRLLDASHQDALYRFELENRAFFERTLLPRGDAYYERGHFDEVVRSLLAEQAGQEVGMYLIFDAAGEIVGRINLTDIAYGPVRKAEVGYRIGQAHQGKRYATQAMALVLREARDTFGLHRLEAGTAPDNIGSQIVLIKNGFRQAGLYHQYIQINGVWQDSLLFERILDAPDSADPSPQLR